jgi:hypothetical protein
MAYMDELTKGAAGAAAQDQATALEDAPPAPDTAMTPSAAAAAGYEGERVDESTFGGEDYDKDWDPGWVRILRNRLLKNGLISEDDLTDKALFDPKHRSWLNKQLKKYNQSAKSEEGTGETEEPTEEPAPQTGGVDSMPGQEVPATLPPAMANNNVPPRVIPSGRLPTGEIFQTTAGPWGSGWIPAGNGLYWPPWPSTGGPIAKPGPQRAGGAAPPMPRTLDAEGQASAIERG